MNGSDKNEFGASWWARKWNNALNKFGWGARLQRGRSYARAGRVKEFDIKPGIIEAKVVGSSPRPYRVKIEIDKIPEASWDVIIEKLSEKAIFTAKLLAGEMPENIDEALESGGVSIFPEKLNSIKTVCSCPDMLSPCKHIAAVYYIAGQEFDKDPFLIFKLRGINKNELMSRLKHARGIKDIGRSFEENTQEVREVVTSGLKNLHLDFKYYKGLNPNIINMGFFYEPPEIPHALVKRLGAIQFFKNDDEFFRLMSLYYDKASEMISEELFKE
jgi:uncharacterized Zn finger protein